MSQNVSGSVKSMWRESSGGWRVTIDVESDGADFEIEVLVRVPDATEAIDSARQFLSRLGRDMSATFATPGSLS